MLLGRGESSENLWTRLTIAVAVIEAIIAVFIMFGRSSFFDVITSTIIFNLIDTLFSCCFALSQARESQGSS